MKTAMRWVTNLKNKIQEKLGSKFVLKFPGKNSVNMKSVGLFGVPTLLILGIVYSFLSAPEDTSLLTKTTESIKEPIAPSAETGKQPGSVKGIASETASEEKRERGRSSLAMRPTNINYRAKQVIERADYSDPSNTLPMGANFVGRLMTSIDTRDGGSFSKIELPYGGSFQGNELLPQGSILFAGVKYDGNGEKVFLDFHSGVYPDGQEFKIRAQALSARDFSPGIEGDYHGTFSNRVAANLGLTFVSGLTEALIEKESAGNGGAFAPSTTVPKATLKNGLLSGVSKVTDSEAQRMAKELAGKQPFVTVDAGKELIVGLLERFVKGSHSEPGNKDKQ